MTTEKIKSLLLMNENKKITVTLLAKKMNVSKATMSRMINTFYEQGLTLDKGKCQLSKKGQEYIEKIQEKIKNLTYWLQETSHLNEEEARQEAIKLYTTLNDETIERICSRIHFNKVFDQLFSKSWSSSAELKILLSTKNQDGTSSGRSVLGRPN